MSIFKIISDIKNSTSHSVAFLLNDDINSTLSKSGIVIRKLFAPTLRLLYKTQTKYKIVVNSRSKLDKTSVGKIFVINHRQSDDIIIGATAVNQSAYIVFGNSTLALETVNGFALWAYGMILLNRSSKTSRNAAVEKMKYVLNHGGNIIIFPEGFWNLDDNGLADERHMADAHNSISWLIQDINIGIVKIAQEIGCEIVPTVLHYDEIGVKRCYVTRGAPITVSKTDDIWSKKDEIVENMQTIYYSLMEKYSSYNRSHIEKKTLSKQWHELQEELLSACDIPKINYKLDSKDEKRIGKAKVVKNITTDDVAFSHLKLIVPTVSNAFLFNKRLK